MKKLFIALSLPLLILALSSCNKDVTHYTYTYKGENDEWTAEYTLTSTDTFTTVNGVLNFDRDQHSQLKATYKHDIAQLMGIDELTIAYKTSAGGGSISESYSEDESPRQTYTLSGGGNGAVPLKDETIHVTVTLDGQEQAFDLNPT